MMTPQDWFTDLLDDIQHPGRVRKAGVYAASGAAMLAAHYFDADLVIAAAVFIGGLFGLYQIPNDE